MKHSAFKKLSLLKIIEAHAWKSKNLEGKEQMNVVVLSVAPSVVKLLYTGCLNFKVIGISKMIRDTRTTN